MLCCFWTSWCCLFYLGGGEVFKFVVVCDELGTPTGKHFPATDSLVMVVL